MHGVPHVVRQGREIVDSGLEDVGVCPEGDCRAGVIGGTTLLKLGLRNAMLVALAVDRLVALYLDIKTSGERVDDGDTDAMQTAGHRVAATAELSAGVQDSENYLNGRFLLDRMLIDRNTAPVVDHTDAAVSEEGYDDVGRIAGHCLIDRVVDDLVDQVMQSALARGADVHAGALANSVEAFENGNRAGVVRHSGGTSRQESGSSGTSGKVSSLPGFQVIPLAPRACA